MTERSTAASQQALRVLAKSVFKELKGAGYNRGEMVAFASQLLDLVTREIRTENADVERKTGS